MLGEFDQAIQTYYKKWQTLVDGRTNKEWFAALKPTAMAWKTFDLDDFDKCFTELRGHADQIHFGWVNERWLTTIHLRDIELPHGITVIKLMQRRPGSNDPVGLDHLDFYAPDVNKPFLEKEPNLKWSEEKNGDVCKWLSIWFDNTEAKLRNDTVLDVCIKEMADLKQNILS